MEYAYAVLLLHESGEELNQTNISEVLEAANVPVEESRVKALVASLEDVNIDEAISAASAGDIPDEATETDEDIPDPDVGVGADADEDDEDDDDESISDLFG